MEKYSMMMAAKSSIYPITCESSSSGAANKKEEEECKMIQKSICFSGSTISKKDYKYPPPPPSPSTLMMMMMPPSSSSSTTSSIKHHHEGDTGIKTLFPVLVSYITRDRSDRAILIGSTVYIVGSHVYPDLESMDSATNDRLLRGFGGRNSLSGRYLFYCDLKSPSNNGWKRGPLMNRCSYNPHPIALDGKIYVVGGTFGDDLARESMAEVFDPCLQRWESVPPPPDDWFLDTKGGTVCLSAAVDHPKRILLSSLSTEAFYIYDVANRCWGRLDCPGYQPKRCLDSGYSFHHIRDPTVVVGQTLYWFSDIYKIVTYDLEEKIWLRGRVKGVKGEDYFEFSHYPKLIHIHGDLFGFIWTKRKSIRPDPMPVTNDSDSDCDSEDSDSDRDNVPIDPCPRYHYDPKTCPTQIHCTKIRVSKRLNSRGKLVLSAFVESCQCHVVDHSLRFAAWASLMM